jgi:hypothetical protein
MDDLAETSIRNALAAVKDKLVSGRKKLLFLQLPGPDEIAYPMFKDMADREFGL